MKILISILFIFVLAIGEVFAQIPVEYLTIAAENNPGLKAGYREFEAALERIPQVKSLPDPMLMAGFTAWPSETMPGMQKARVSLNQMFPWFGTLRASGDQAALQAEARYQNFIDKRNDLYFQVAAAWYPLYELSRIRRIEQENIRILDSYKNIATRNFENGTGPMVDVLRADIMLNDAQTRLLLLDDREESLLAVFNSLLNRKEDATVKIPDTLQINGFLPAFNRDSLLKQNPRLRELDFRYRASEVGRDLARRQGLPGFGVGLEYMLMDMQPEMGAPGQTRGALMPMVTMSIPIYRGKYKAAQEEARLMQESYSLQTENTLNMLSAEYSRAYNEVSQQQKMLELFDRQIQTTHQTLNLLFRSYSNSGNDFEEVLRTQQQLLQYEREKASAQTELFTAHARINYLTAKTTDSNENR